LDDRRGWEEQVQGEASIKGGKGTFDASTITGTFSFYGFSFYFLLFGTPVLSLHFFLCRQSYSTFYVFFFSICYRDVKKELKLVPVARILHGYGLGIWTLRSTNVLHYVIFSHAQAAVM